MGGSKRLPFSRQYQPPCRVQTRMAYPARLYKIRDSDEKFFVSTGVVVIVDPQHRKRTEVQRVDVQGVYKFWDRDSLR